MKKTILVFTFLFSIIFTGCQAQNNVSSYNIDQCIILHPVKDAERFSIGQINANTEKLEYGIFQNQDDSTFSLIVNIGNGEKDSVPHVKAYKDRIYYLSSSVLHFFDCENPSIQSDLMPQSLIDDSDGYVLNSFISIDDDWVYLKAEKWGTNELGTAIHVPVNVAISTDGKQWKEVV